MVRWRIIQSASFSVVAVVMVLMFALSSCVTLQPERSPTATAPRLLSTSAAPEAVPSPMATAHFNPPRVAVSLGSEPLHGPPPFTAHFLAETSGYFEQMPACQTAHWDFGDGASEVQPCQLGTSTSRFQISHVYRDTGTYHARLTLILSNGEAINSTSQTVVVAIPQPVSPGAEILRWSAWAASLAIAISGVLWLRRRSRRWRISGYTIIALGLITFVTPFSYLPNPIGLYWAWAGDYAYDPRLPFINRFVVAGDPEAQLRPFLDGLIGQTGLDPLDPVQPLAHYDFAHVSLPHQYPGVVFVTTRLTYQNGSQRTYDIPLYQSEDFFGWYRSGWRNDGLGRLRTEQRELTGTPFVNADSALRLSTPQLLSLDPAVQQFDATNPANWGPYGSDWQHLRWSPRVDAFLAARSAAADRRDLWQIDLTGKPPRLVAENVLDYDWSPDGEYIVFTRINHQPNKAQAIAFVVTREGRNPRELAQLGQVVFPGLSKAGAWYTVQDDLWIAPYDDQPPYRVTTLTGLASSPLRSAGPLVRPAPDEVHIAYTCAGGDAVCVYDQATTQLISLDAPVSEMAWSPDSAQLAVITAGTYGNSIEGDQPVKLILAVKSGEIKRVVSIAPNGWADAPQWTPDARRVFVQTYPYSGRRILTTDISTGETLDLSQPRWDAWFALSPDGRQLLLNNGRGGFWTVWLETSTP
jgi:Tol biopolymer transport system component